MVSEGNLAVRFFHSSQKELDFLLLRRSGEGSAPDGSEHLGAPVVVSDRDHGLHDA